MERPPASRTSRTRLFSPYRYGERKWEDYLLDTQTLIYDGARAQVEAVDRAARETAEKQDNQQILLQSFIANAEGAWDRVDSQLDTLTDQLITGFSSLGYQLDYHSVLLTQVVDRLGQIAKILASPLATEANELVRSGEHLMKRELYAEAYADLTAAEGKRSVNPILHMHLAQLHCDVKHEGVPYDLSVAERHANLAIRYAMALRDDLEESGAAVLDLVFRTGAHVAFIKGGDLVTDNGPEAGDAELLRADDLLRRIDAPSPSSRFLHAQVLTQLRRLNDAFAKVKELADSNRIWIQRALREPNLAAIAEPVGSLSADLRANPGVHSQQAYRAIAGSRGWAMLSTSSAADFSSPATDLSLQIGEIERNFEVGAIDAGEATNACQASLEKARGTTLAAMLASLNRLDTERSQAIEAAERNAERARQMQNYFHAKFGGVCLFMMFGGFVGCAVSVATSHHLVFSLIPVYAGAVVGAMVYVVWIEGAAIMKRSRSRAVVPALKASEMRARAAAELADRRSDEVKRMRDALGL